MIHSYGKPNAYCFSLYNKYLAKDPDISRIIDMSSLTIMVNGDIDARISSDFFIAHYIKSYLEKRFDGINHSEATIFDTVTVDISRNDNDLVDVFKIMRSAFLSLRCIRDAEFKPTKHEVASIDKRLQSVFRPYSIAHRKILVVRNGDVCSSLVKIVKLNKNISDEHIENKLAASGAKLAYISRISNEKHVYIDATYADNETMSIAINKMFEARS